jgi:hypothetical protein
MQETATLLWVVGRVLGAANRDAGCKEMLECIVENQAHIYRFRGNAAGMHASWSCMRAKGHTCMAEYVMALISVPCGCLVRACA